MGCERGVFLRKEGEKTPSGRRVTMLATSEQLRNVRNRQGWQGPYATGIDASLSYLNGGVLIEPREQVDNGYVFTPRARREVAARAAFQQRE